MQIRRGVRDECGVHHTQLAVGSPDYQMGQKQAKLSIQYYHTLVAALTKKYTYMDMDDPSALLPGSRQIINLSPYKAYKLDNITGVKLHSRADGLIHPEDLKAYHENFTLNWKTQEGGVLYCVGMSDEFWNCIRSYHGPLKSTGSKKWDDLFHELESTAYAKNIIPCMVRISSFRLQGISSYALRKFFGREAGCMDKKCPFLHDRDAVLANRAQVLATRRATFNSKITPKQRFARERMLVAEAGQDPARRSEFMRSERYKQAAENGETFARVVQI
jgi:hypothetical protein